MGLVESIRTIVSNLIGSACTESLLVKGNYHDYPCLKLLLSKVLSFGIILGAIVVKLPQLAKLLLSRSAVGLSFLSYLLETIGLSITFAYNLRQGNPFTTYGETLFIIIQNLIIIMLMGVYRRQSMQLVLMTALYSVFMSSLLVPDFLSKATLAYLQAATIPILTMSKIPQILKVWMSSSTGQLSALTVFLVWAGSIARVFTTIQEVSGDQLLLIATSLAGLLNSVLAVQMIYYWKSPKVAGPRKVKKN